MNNPQDEWMGRTGPDLLALAGSRMAHDLANPLGAVGNGLELLELSGAGDMPEMALMKEAMEAARGRLGYFRIAFGHAGADATLPRAEIDSAIAGTLNAARHRVEWQAGDAPERRMAKVALLCLLCLETAMPVGGEIEISQTGGDWCLTGRAKRFVLDPALFALLDNAPPPADLAASKVHFPLAAKAARAAGREIGFEQGENTLRLFF
ncbi:MAG: histidine phosphotransferase [Rhodobacterales bacterium]|nr:MAG: histidine phosphotransferase [Rhodobacterales bacterium]PIE06390.1 MAG: histidine phosphotransferase [Rhodobacterales bacterium]